MAEPIISLSDVNFSYSGQHVLDHVGFAVKRGEYVGIVGPNGGGKTTLLRLILGLLESQSGSVKLFGTPIERFKDWSKIGYVPQRVSSLEIKFPISVEEVVMLGRVGKRGLLKRLNAEDRAVVEETMKQAEITDLRHRLLTELSGGQLQRVFIAKALASEPQILILDEPTVGVDLESQDAFYDLLAKLNKEQKLTLLLVSHDIDVVVNEATTLIAINETVVYEGTPQDFIKEDYLSHLYGKGRKMILHGHGH